MTPEEAAQKAGTTRWSIMRAIKAHALRASRDNRNRWNIAPDDLAAWCAAHRQQGAPTERTVSTPPKVAQEAAQVAQAEVAALTAKLVAAEAALARECVASDDLRTRLTRSEEERRAALVALEEERRTLRALVERIMAPDPAPAPRRGFLARLLGA